MHAGSNSHYNVGGGVHKPLFIKRLPAKNIPSPHAQIYFPRFPSRVKEEKHNKSLAGSFFPGVKKSYRKNYSRKSMLILVKVPYAVIYSRKNHWDFCQKNYQKRASRESQRLFDHRSRRLKLRGSSFIVAIA